MNFFMKSVAVTLFVTFSNIALAKEMKTVEWLFIHTAEKAEMVSDSSFIMPMNREVLAFTDRPNRQYRYLKANDYVELWRPDAADGFKINPPNSVISWMVGDTPYQAKVNILNSTITNNGDAIFYEIGLLEEIKIPEQIFHVSLFVGGVCGGNGKGGGKGVGVLIRCK